MKLISQKCEENFTKCKCLNKVYVVSYLYYRHNLIYNFRYDFCNNIEVLEN